jgi:DNA mismatch repair protein MutS2
MLGIPGKSYGLIMAKRYGLAPQVVAHAEKYLAQQQASVEQQTLLKLQAELQEITSLKQSLLEQQAALVSKQKVLDQQSKQLQLKEAHLKETQQAEQANLLAETLSKVDAAIKTLANPDLKLHEAIRLKQTLTELLKSTNQAEPNEAILDVAVGDYVEETNTRMRGKVINLSKQSLTMVTADGLTVKVKLTQVEKTTPPSASQPSKALRLVQSQKAPSSITIIGLRYEEAKQAVEKYYDLALLSSLKTIKIIHGFGSGTLRKMVYDYFQGLTTIKTIQQGEGDQAGYGVTIIHFK